MSRSSDNGQVHIRPEILRNYYESMFGKTAPGEDAFQGATFEEYHSLLRISYATISREKAAARSKNPAFKAMAEKFAAETAEAAADKGAEGAPKERKKSAVFERLPALDLAAAELPGDLHSLFLDRVKSVSGLERLQRLASLRVFEAILCDTSEDTPIGSRLRLTRLDLNECSGKFAKTVLGMARAEWIRVLQLDPPVFDIGLLRECKELRVLYLTCGLTLDARHLQGLPLEILWLTNVEMRSDFRDALTSLAKTLRELKIENETPFNPDALPGLPGLKKLIVPAYAEFKAAWISFAVSHPRILCAFPPVSAPAGKLPKARIVEIYKGVDVLEMGKGGKVWYEVWGDLAARLKGKAISNNELKDRLVKFASACKPKVKLSSEGDELRMQSDSIESLRSCLDATLEALKPRGDEDSKE
ncbi:MAG TPA: hypothetical protein VJ385_10905 [Fibrobacteria bacterium]|nr:hypothetical protein [Fibrobacteria bacterium]